MSTSDTTMRPTKSSVRAWRWISTLLAVSQLASPPVVARLFGDFLASGDTNRALITPSGYAFSIWGVITLLTVVTGVAVLRHGLGSPWETRVLVELSVVYTGFTTWLVVAAQDWLWVSVAVFAIMNVALVDAVRLTVCRARDLTCPGWVRGLATVTFGLYLGWSSVAVFVNVAAAAIGTGAPAGDVGWQAAILVAATAAALVLTYVLRGSPGYVAAVVWALVAASIGAAHRGSTVLAAAGPRPGGDGPATPGEPRPRDAPGCPSRAWRRVADARRTARPPRRRRPAPRAGHHRWPTSFGRRRSRQGSGPSGRGRRRSGRNRATGRRP
ncbi:hypothetical protein [Mycobacterium sp. NPDC006124]|uniref:hypothetical protein n=1 Tax=Mycobacterium sp. NPDC006124 TaxID=3156729 RepID=UPI0033A9CAC2